MISPSAGYYCNACGRVYSEPFHICPSKVANDSVPLEHIAQPNYYTIDPALIAVLTRIAAALEALAKK